jgi:hypothetical protein
MGITVGKPDVTPDRTAHVKGVHEGNRGAARHQPGHLEDDTSTARRSTGINARKHDPLMPDMPNLSPA